MSAEVEALFHPKVSALACRRGLSALGRLGPWWLRDETLAELNADAGAVNDLRSGEFVVLLMRTAPSEVVQEGLALPLRWKRTTAPDRRLPESLAELGRRIEALSGTRQDPGDSFRLALGDDCPDLSRIRIETESAGAMLAATLEASRLSAEIDARVTATATWGGADLGPVEGLAAKAAAARRLGLAQVFVSRFQHPIDDGLADLVRRLDGRNATEQVHGLMLALDAPPEQGSFEARCEWYHRHSQQGADRERSQRFFCERLALELAGRSAPIDRPYRLAVIASGRPESAVFAACVHRPHELVVLHEDSEQGRRFARRTADGVRASTLDVRIQPRAMSCPGAGYPEFLESVRTRLGDDCSHRREATHVDLTGGTTLMKLAVADAARTFGMRRFIVDQRDHAKGGSPLVTTLRVIEIPHDSTDGARVVS